MSIYLFYQKKQSHQPISMVTCYDYPFAKIIEQSPIDCVLVGDSVATTIHGLPNTTHATNEMMILHTRAVARGLKTTFLVADLPFLSYRKSLETTMEIVHALIQAGAHAVKLEGTAGNLETIAHIVDSGIPVMGHIGLTPQQIHQLGGHRVQGKNAKQAQVLIDQAKQLEQAGCFSLVLECIPATLAQRITDSLDIATIGIGAGPHTDGQVLVLTDLLGLDPHFNPKFLKKYLSGYPLIAQALEDYTTDVTAKHFPSEVHCYAE